MSVADAPAPTGHVGRALRRKEDPRADHRPGPVRRRHRAARECCGRRSCARPRRTPRSSRSTPPRRAQRPGIHAVFTGEDMADLGGPLPMAWVPPGRRGQQPRRTGRWRAATVNHVGDPVAVVIGEDRYAVVDAAEDVVVEYEPLPVVVDPEAAIAGGAVRARGARHQQGPRVVAARRRRRGRLRRGRRDRRAPGRQPPDRRRADRVPRRARRLPRRLADPVDLDPGAALRAPVHGAAARAQRGPRARDRARGRRRLRRRSCRSTARS